MQRLEQEGRDRIKSVLAVGAVHLAIGWALISGLRFHLNPEAEPIPKIFDVLPEIPPPPIAEPERPKEKKQKARAPKPEGAASPKNLKDMPSPVVAPPPIVPLPVPTPVVAAPIAAQGNRASAGAADVPGPGTGSGGQGTGRGSGDAGDGTGGGGGGGDGRGVIQLSGRITDLDYPDVDIPFGTIKTVYLRFVVAPDGRVPDCKVTRSSGSPAIDKATCRLIKRRFRYDPARDEYGRPVPSIVMGEHRWGQRAEPPPIDVEPEYEDE